MLSCVARMKPDSIYVMRTYLTLQTNTNTSIFLLLYLKQQLGCARYLVKNTSRHELGDGHATAVF